MKHAAPSLLPALALLAAATTGIAIESPIDDASIRKSFERELGALLDASETAAPEELAEQLGARASAQFELSDHVRASGESEDSASVYQRARGGVLCFGNIYKCDRCDNWHGNIAGGFVISKDGLAVTNYHVMEAEKAGAFGAMDIEGKVYPVVEVVAASKRDDLAIVRLKGEGFQALPVAKESSAGADVTVISHPEGRFFTVSEGIIARYYRSRSRRGPGPVRVAITADFAKGSSGCPVLNEDGAVVGVVASTDSVYYDEKDGVERNLQMVVKSCIPSGAIYDLRKEEE